MAWRKAEDIQLLGRGPENDLQIPLRLHRGLHGLFPPCDGAVTEGTQSQQSLHAETSQVSEFVTIRELHLQVVYDRKRYRKA